MDDIQYGSALVLASFVGWIMVWLPSLVFLLRFWRARRDMLFDYLDDHSLRLYYAQFFPSEDLTNVDAVQLKGKFKSRFYSLYGKRWYCTPILLLAFLAGVGVWSTALFLFGILLSPREGSGVLWVAVSAFLGAYMWVVNDQLGRLRTRDFTPHDVYNCVYRFLIAVPMGYCLGKLAASNMAVPVAFFLGTFPTTTLFKYGRRIVDQKLNLGDEPNQQSTELEKLQCVGRSQAERFNDVGITTIAQLAWSNPVDLTIRSNLEFNYIIDTVSQALLWVYLEDATRQLYRLGLRGAMEANNLVEAIDHDDDCARQTLKAAAVLLKMDEGTLRHTLNEVAYDPYTEFLVEVWH